jgi:hypothetical protein
MLLGSPWIRLTVIPMAVLEMLFAETTPSLRVSLKIPTRAFSMTFPSIVKFLACVNAIDQQILGNLRALDFESSASTNDRIKSPNQ